MTGDSNTPRTGAELYRSGPWLVTYGHGPDSEEAAARVCEQCAVHSVDAECHAIDQAANINHAYFPGLVVALPSTSLRSGLEQSAGLIFNYRARRPQGLKPLLSGDCKWYEAGVIHVIGLHAVMPHPRIRSALARSCAKYYLDDPEPPDLFKIYTGQNVALVQTAPENTESNMLLKNGERAEIDNIWHYLQSWGLTKIDDISRILKCIERCRDHFEDPRSPQLHRPIPGRQGNRLDIILDGPRDVVVGNHKTWMENGARVWRYVEAQLREVEPNFSRPGGLNRKGAQADLRKFYLNLRTFADYMQLPY